MIGAKLTLRPVAPGDGELLYRIYASTREEELAAVPWDGRQREAFLRAQFAAQSQWYEQHYVGASRSIVLLDDEPCGRLYVLHGGSEIRIMDIALLPEYRGRGVGGSLLRDVLDEGERAGKLVTIHVERFNPALRLYERLGFTVVEDKGVYLLLERPPAT